VDAAAELERVARLSHGRLAARLAARTGSLSAAMDALSDALVRALEVWPRDGVPSRPEAWLMTVARNRAADAARAGQRGARAVAHLALLEDERHAMAHAVTPDRTLDLMFVCAHPAIDAGMRTPLMLQLVLGLDARRMAAAFLIPPATLGQRLTRARAKIEAARIGFELPEGDDLVPRLGPVLDAVYAAFTVGTDGDGAGDAKSASLAREALWLGSLVAARLPDQPEAQGLLALMLFTFARRGARVDASGCLVPLEAHDTRQWDGAMMDDAESSLRLAARMPTLGRYQIEAAIAAAHTARRHGTAPDPGEIVALYRGLVALHPSLGAEVGLAGALIEAGDAPAALAVLDAADPARAKDYQPWWAVRAHAQRHAGNGPGAAAAFDRAIALTADPAVRLFLTRCRDAPGPRGAPR
jgi:RNA polymerase sigma-70 factor (ECF subfamily)